MPGYSLHIGLNHCDPAAYPGWDSTLGGCINDANSMMQVASAAGFRTKRMIDGEATSAAVLSAIGTLASTCRAGDIALISYSGHGGQVPDTNGDEGDGQDETWVLYDRQVCDDELNQMYLQFAAGVRVLIVSDSCHSGTVARSVVNLATRHAIARNPLGKDMWPAGVKVEEARPRAMPPSIAMADVRRRRGVYELAQTLTRGARSPDPAASVILLSGCQDNQLSFDGAINGAFTTALLAVWNQGRFNGDYRAFHAAIVSRMPADQTPNFYTLGDVSGFQGQRPFSVEGAASGSGGGATPTARPQIQQGSYGPDVVYLQQRLTVHGYTLAADGQFGPKTTQAVKAFQLSRGLSTDGIVGTLTWQALERSPSDAGSGGSWDNGSGSGSTGSDGYGGSDGGSDGGWGTDSNGSDGDWGTDSDGSDGSDGGWTDSGSSDGGGDTDGGWGTDSGGTDSGGGDTDGGWGTDSGSGDTEGGWGTDSGGTDGDTDGGTDGSSDGSSDGSWGDSSGWG